MGKIIVPRFDTAAVSRRLEERWVRDVACPIVRPDGTTENVLTLMQLHWCQHGVPTLVERRGEWVSDHRCSEPCPALAIAAAHLEIHWFVITMLEIEEYRRLELAVSKLSPDDPLYAELVNQANYLAAHFVSQAAVFESFFSAAASRMRTLRKCWGVRRRRLASETRSLAADPSTHLSRHSPDTDLVD